MRGNILESFKHRASHWVLAVALAGAGSAPALAQALPPPSPAGDSAGQGDQASKGDQPGQADEAIDPAVPSTAAKAGLPPRRRTKRDLSSNVAADGTIEVTGSRLVNGDPTAQVTVLTEKDIKARGVTSLEELVRTLPQNLATIGAITNERTRGPLSSSARGQGAVSTLGSLGVSAANLGGSGAGNTLILVNGRRMAGAAGIEDGFVNLNSIPLSAVERVEIDTSGSAAIYGSDAIGGVINFILKKNYTGTTVSAQHEFSENQASGTRFNIASGYAWGSGSISGTVSYDHRNPINNYKSGYTTQNYSSLYGGDPQYDLRGWSRGLQPGVIVSGRSVFDPVTNRYTYVEQALSPRPGLTGAPGINDFVQLDPSAKRDYVPKYAGPKTDSISASLNFNQNLTERLSLFANGLYTHSKATQDQDYRSGLSVELAPGQAYNPFPAYSFSNYTIGTQVYYFPAAELASGAIPPSKAISTNDTWSINAGLTWNLGHHTKLEFVFTTSTAKSFARSTKLGSLVSLIKDPTQASGFSCYNNGIYPGVNLDTIKAAFAKQCAALTSSDPAVAFNPWRTGAGGTGGSVTDFIYEDAQEQRQSQVKNYELRLNGNLLTLPAGMVAYATGGDYNDDGVNSREVNIFTGTAASRKRYAFFGEVTVPLAGGNFSLPLVRELTVNAALRNDTYLTDGAIGTVDNVPYDAGGKLVYGHNRFSRFTPSFGVRWAPFHELALRAKWSSGFRAPPYTQLFNLNGTRQFTTYIFNDPLYKCTSDCAFGANSGIYSARSTTAPNPDLKPQTSSQQSFSASWAPGGMLQGLNAVVTYSHTRISNEYANMSQLASVMKAGDVLRILQFYPRDANGKITEQRNMIFNIAGSEYSSVNVEAHWRFDTRLGTFTPGVNYLRNLKSQRQVFADTPVISTLGSIRGVDRYKMVGQLDWAGRDVNVTLWAYYTPSYVNDYLISMYAGVVANADQNRQVASFTTFDLTGSWSITPSLRVNVAGRNIFAASPPFALVDSRPYDTARYNAAGRTFSIELQKTF